MGEASAVAALDAPLALVEAIDRDGLVRQAWRVERWPVSIGRALDNTVVLSDPHVAAHHASVDLVRDDDSGTATIRSPPARPGTASSSAASTSPPARPSESPTMAATSSCTSAGSCCGCACRAMRSAPSRR